MMTSNTKSPTRREKVEMYEYFLHKINMFVTSCNNEGIAELVHNADMWSYAHRMGECVSDKKRKQMITNAFYKLCDTPEADKASKERQKAYMDALQCTTYAEDQEQKN